MTKLRKFESKLSQTNPPIIKNNHKYENKIGLINSSKTRNVTFRLHIDVIDDLKMAAKDISERLNTEILPTHFIEIMCRHIRKNPTKFIKMLKS